MHAYFGPCWTDGFISNLNSAAQKSAAKFYCHFKRLHAFIQSLCWNQNLNVFHNLILKIRVDYFAAVKRHFKFDRSSRWTSVTLHFYQCRWCYKAIKELCIANLPLTHWHTLKINIQLVGPASFGGNEYLFPDMVMVFQDARGHCQTWRGDLASITSAEENNFIATYTSRAHNCLNST